MQNIGHGNNHQTIKIKNEINSIKVSALTGGQCWLSLHCLYLVYVWLPQRCAKAKHTLIRTVFVLQNLSIPGDSWVTNCHPTVQTYEMLKIICT